MRTRMHVSDIMVSIGSDIYHVRIQDDVKLTFDCACCGRSVPLPPRSLFNRTEVPSYCKQCSSEKVCHSCSRHFIPSGTEGVRIWQDDDGMVNRYSCSEECFRKRRITCHRCRRMFPAGEAVISEGCGYCSEYCRDHIKCLWCQLTFERERCLNDRFCSMACEVQYYNVQDDGRKR